MTAYYNEIDTFCVEWLRNLIAAGHIADGEVDDRSIEDVLPSELRGFTQCHFFAGIGVWSHALRRAGWDDSRPVWTGSCPCQPFSAAGKGAGASDERHLWPAFHHLIRECRPNIVFGEQVASAIGHGWLDLVQDDLEGEGYAVGATVFPACSVGAPHIRQRLYWVADAKRDRRSKGKPDGGGCDERVGAERELGRVTERGSVDELAGSCGERSQRHWGLEQKPIPQGWEGEEGHGTAHRVVGNAAQTNGFWRDADWLFCRDGKRRPVEPSTFPLAYGASQRVGRLRAYGNAIVAPQAKAFIESFMECRP